MGKDVGVAVEPGFPTEIWDYVAHHPRQALQGWAALEETEISNVQLDEFLIDVCYNELYMLVALIFKKSFVSL